MSSSMPDRKRQKTKARTPTPRGSSGASSGRFSPPEPTSKANSGGGGEDGRLSPIEPTHEGYPTLGDTLPQSRPFSPGSPVGCHASGDCSSRSPSRAPTPQWRDFSSSPVGGASQPAHAPQDDIWPTQRRTPPPCFFCRKEWEAAGHRYLSSTGDSTDTRDDQVSDSCPWVLTPREHFTLGKVLVCDRCDCALPAPEATAASSSGQGAQVTSACSRAGTPGPIEPRFDLSAAFGRLLVEEPQLSPEDRIILLTHKAGTPLNGDSPLTDDKDRFRNFDILPQTSKSTCFDLNLDESHCCRFYYDVGSDDLVAYNRGSRSIWLVALNIGAATGPNKTLLLASGKVEVIAPGYWGMGEVIDNHRSGPLLVEFLLLRRRWTFEQCPLPTTGDVGSRQAEAESDMESAQVVYSDFSHGDNPMLQFGPSMVVKVKFPTAPDERDSSQNFDITNFRDIVKPNRATAVFDGYHSGLKAYVAVKIVRRQPDQKQRLKSLADDFFEEVRLLRTLDHSGIVECLDYDCRWFMICMENLGQKDLGMQRDKNDMFTGPLVRAKRILKEMANVFVYLEGKGVLHNDIKPRNIMFHPKRGAVLIDFGLATEVDDGQSGGGTYPYVAPERYTGAAPSAPNEIYSLGITMLYLLKKVALPEKVLRPPWTTGDPGWRYKAWLYQVEEMREELGGSTEGIVHQMLDKCPIERITARQILEQL